MKRFIVEGPMVSLTLFLIISRYKKLFINTFLGVLAGGLVSVTPSGGTHEF